MKHIKCKYIRTPKDEIIFLPEAMLHDTLKDFNPVSAGFVEIFVNSDNEMSVVCSGESNSLNLRSIPEMDEKLIRTQYQY